MIWCAGMKSLITFLIVDIEAPAYRSATLQQLQTLSPVEELVLGVDYMAVADIESCIKQKSKAYDSVMVVRLGDQLSQDLIGAIPEFLNSKVPVLAVNYVNRYGFNSEPRIWSKRVWIVDTEHLLFDGYQLLQPKDNSIVEYSELEVYNNIGVNLRSEQLKSYDLDSLHIYSQVCILNDWITVRQLNKASEIGHHILKINLNTEVRYYVLNQLSAVAMVDQNKETMSQLVEAYQSDVQVNPLVLADYFFVNDKYEEVLEVLEGYDEPDFAKTGLPYDRERYRAYVYFLQAKSLLLLGRVEEAIKISELFYLQSIVLRHQIKWVRLLRQELGAGIVKNREVSTAPNFLVVSQPRTGSTWLQSLLNSHSKLTCYGELLAINKPRYGAIGTDIASVGSDLKLRESDPIGFVSRLMQQPRSGFKLHLFQLDDYEKYSLWPWLLDNGNTKVLYLKRRDVVATYISFVLASNNNYWQTQRNESRVFDTVEINLVHFKTYMEKMNEWEEKYISQVLPGSLMKVYYEDLLQNGMEDVQIFLGADYQELSSGTVKQNMIPLEYIVRNLDKVLEFYQESQIYV